MFDEMGVRIREKWDEIVQRPYGELDISNSAVREERERKNLHFIVFKPMTAAVENGVVIPGVSSMLLGSSSLLIFFYSLVKRVAG